MKRTKNILCSLLACLLVILAVPTAVSAAAKKPSCAKKQTVEFEKQGHLTPKMGDQSVLTGDMLKIKNLSRTAKITKLKSSNKMFVVKAENGGVAVFAPGNKVKTGDQTKVTFTVRQNGKSYKMSCLVTFKQTACFKNFKIGSKDYAKTVNGYWMTGAKIARKNKVKISITPKSAYKVDSIVVTYKNGTEKPVKNGKTISLKNASNIHVSYHEKKSPKNYREVNLYLW